MAKGRGSLDQVGMTSIKGFDAGSMSSTKTTPTASAAASPLSSPPPKVLASNWGLIEEVEEGESSKSGAESSKPSGAAGIFGGLFKRK